MREAKLQVTAGAVTGMDSRDAVTTTLRIEDHASGVTLVALDLTSETLMRLLRGTVVTLDGKVADADQFARVGIEQEVEQVDYPDANVPYGKDRDRALRALEARARKEHPGWDEYDARSTNQGGKVVLRRWRAQEAGE